MNSIPQDESNRGARTLWHYDHYSPVVYDENRNLRMRSFRCTLLLVSMQPVCTDCGAATQRGYVSEDGGDSVVYCENCVRAVLEAYKQCDEWDCPKPATFYRRGEGLHFCESHRQADDIPFLQ